MSRQERSSRAAATTAPATREASEDARELRDTFADALVGSLEARPYATLAAVAGIGFLAGAIWRR